VDRRRFELQVEAVLVVYRAQHRVVHPDSLGPLRQRSHEILDGLAAETDGDPHRARLLEDARQELDAPIGDGQL
jgi:hypothetical protein